MTINKSIAAMDLIGFEKDGKDFPYIEFLLNSRFDQIICVAICSFLRDANGNKTPVKKYRSYRIIGSKVEKDTGKIIFIIDEL